jgi:broad specificity phosphatase PhoE
LTGARPDTTLLFVRHGESEANAAGRYAGQTDSPLTERGRRQAEAVADALADARIDRVVSSDLSRARDTAEAIARRHGLTVEAFPELREIDVGEAAGRSIEDARTRFDWGPATFVEWPGGESLDEVRDRAVPAIERIAAASPGRTVCVVGHGGVTRILVSHFLGLLPELYRHHSPTANTNVTVVKTDGITYRVESLFEAGHLAAKRPPSPEERMPEPGVTDAI